MTLLQQNVILKVRVTANKLQIIVHRLCSIHRGYPPSGMDFVVTGPDPYPIHMGSGLKQAALHHQEADVLMVYHAILESSNGQHQSCIR